ncbi:MAG: protein translocase SEC61 complex subunit gamma [Candidatus Aenigmatarchaeota archaeon]
MKISLNPIPRIKSFSAQCKRVLMVSSKPDSQEIKLSTKITAIGMIIIGLISFIIYLAFQFIGGL